VPCKQGATHRLSRGFSGYAVNRSLWPRRRPATGFLFNVAGYWAGIPKLSLLAFGGAVGQAVGLVIGLAALEDEPYFQECNRRVIHSRERLALALAELGFEVFPSSANFIFVRHSDTPARTLYLELKSAGILVRHFEAARIDNCLRISIGTDAECDALIAGLKAILN